MGRGREGSERGGEGVRRGGVGRRVRGVGRGVRGVGSGVVEGRGREGWNWAVDAVDRLCMSHDYHMTLTLDVLRFFFSTMNNNTRALNTE